MCLVFLGDNFLYGFPTVHQVRVGYLELLGKLLRGTRTAASLATDLLGDRQSDLHRGRFDGQKLSRGVQGQK